MPRLSKLKSSDSLSAMANKCFRASRASLTVWAVFDRYCGIAAINSASHEYLCQDGRKFIRSGASCLNIHFKPFAIVPQLFQTSALLAESWPPFANEVSIAAYGCRSIIVTL